MMILLGFIGLKTWRLSLLSWEVDAKREMKKDLEPDEKKLEISEEFKS
jgi:hypothetical protein